MGVFVLFISEENIFARMTADGFDYADCVDFS
jgi:hypothetical protein